MRLLTLARIAAEAEGVRLKVLAKRQAMRGVWGVVAAVFGLFLAVMLHLTAFEFLAPAVGAQYAALIIAGADLLLAGIFAILAARDTPSAAELEAGRISRQARMQIAESAKTFALVTPVARAVGGGGLRGALVTTVLTEWLTKKRKKAG